MSKLSKSLASTHEETRDEAILSLDKYITANIQTFKKIELSKLWKGIWYAVWLSDGADNQISLCDNLGKIINNANYAVKDWKKLNESFWTVIIREWENIDQWRMDKYYLLIRRVLRYNFRYLNSKNWDSKMIREFHKFLTIPLTINKNFAIPYHICDIFIDELDQYGDAAPEFIIEVFKTVSNQTKLKTLKEKINEEVLTHENVQQWWGTEEDEDEDDEEDEEEWKGF